MSLSYPWQNTSLLLNERSKLKQNTGKSKSLAFELSETQVTSKRYQPFVPAVGIAGSRKSQASCYTLIALESRNTKVKKLV